MEKKQIIVFVDWFYPAYKGGGPIKSIFNLVNQLRNQYHFSIITSCYDIDGSKIEVEPNLWLKKDQFQVIYLSREWQNKKRYQEFYKRLEPQLIYVNGLFSFSFSILPLLAQRGNSDAQVVISPRGMLGQGALKIKSTKKKLFLNLAKGFGLYKRVVWHATALEEQKEIEMHFGPEIKSVIASNFPSPAHKRDVFFKSKNQLHLVFLSRISKKKNLLFLLKLLNRIHSKMPIRLSIYGPIEDEAYWQECKLELEKNELLSYSGEVKPHEVADLLTRYHFSVLPTFNENYGHSIVESINSGVPVILSDQTPWRSLSESGIGWDLSLKNEKAWESIMEEAFIMDHSEYMNMVRACEDYSKHKIHKKEILDDYEKLFL